MAEPLPRPQSLRIAVMGAGAVGCYYGGMLARAGHAVTLIGRPVHVEAMRRHGLLLETLTFTEHVSLGASSELRAASAADLLLCCVKSTDTEKTAAALAAHLRADAKVLSLQNGVDNVERLQAHLSCPVEPAVVYVASEMAGPGHVRHHGRGELVVGPQALTADQMAQFVAAGIPLEISDNVLATLWVKLLLNCVYNALSAITQIPYGRLVQGEGVLAVMRDVFDECQTVAAAKGISLPADAWQTVLRIAQTMPTQLSSTAQDVARQKPTEIDHLNGYIVRQGELLGVATPVNRCLHAQVKLLESRYRPEGIQDAD